MIGDDDSLYIYIMEVSEVMGIPQIIQDWLLYNFSLESHDFGDPYFRKPPISVVIV